jgi:hypothetical protein
MPKLGQPAEGQIMDNLVGFVGEIILPLLVVYWEFQKGASGDIDFFRNRVEMPVCE